jgi:hypothetical protein
MTSSRPGYSQEDIQQILNLAIARQVQDESTDPGYMLSREQLLEIAEEMHIPLTTLNAAEKDWQEKKGMILCRRDFDLYRHDRFHKTAFRFAVISGGVALLGIIPGVAANTFLLGLYGTFVVIRGIRLALQYWEIRQTEGEAYEEAFQHWYRRYQMRYVVNHWVGKVSRFLGGSPSQSRTHHS